MLDKKLVVRSGDVMCDVMFDWALAVVVHFGKFGEFGE